jgi:YHS domain-containing protein
MKKTVFGLIALSFVLAGCGGTQSQAPAADSGTTVSSAAAAPAGEVLKSRLPKPEELGKEVVCPVMKTKFKVNKTTQVFDYKGKAYFMCCGGCPGPFSKDPEKYVK